MKKVLSHLLIVATLLAPCCKPTHAERTPAQSVRASANAGKLSKNGLKKVFSELAKDPEFSEALKEAFLELSKDNKFTDQVIKNYENAHKEPFLLKLVKLPFRVVWYLIKTTFNYVVGKNVAKVLAWAIPIALLAVDGHFGFACIKSAINYTANTIIPWIFS